MSVRSISGFGQALGLTFTDLELCEGEHVGEPGVLRTIVWRVVCLVGLHSCTFHIPSLSLPFPHSLEEPQPGVGWGVSI